jgi:thioredoxin 2
MPIITCPNCGAKNRIDDRARSLQPVCGKCGQKLPLPSASTTPLIVTDATFPTAVLQADRPVLLDCWAPWCGPCRMVAPIIDQLATESASQYIVAKLNTDENQRTAAQFRIDAIPTLLIFQNGKLADRLVGLQPKQAIAARMQSLLAART